MGCNRIFKGKFKTNYKERFLMATAYKIQKTMEKATIVHKPFTEK